MFLKIINCRIFPLQRSFSKLSKLRDAKRGNVLLTILMFLKTIKHKMFPCNLSPWSGRFIIDNLGLELTNSSRTKFRRKKLVCTYKTKKCTV